MLKIYIVGAIAEGANVLFGGDVIDGAGYYMNPCVMECSDEMTITKEEHFGPVLQEIVAYLLNGSQLITSCSHSDLIFSVIDGYTGMCYRAAISNAEVE